MKVMMVGVGKLGSQVAWHILREFEPDVMVLKDIIDLDGHILDLEHACTGMNIKTNITDEKLAHIMDFIIITAGVGRSEKITTHDELWDINKPIMGKIIEELKTNGNIGPKTIVVVMTNPVERMTELVKNWLPGNIIINPEAELMKARKGKELGWRIVKTKGYTNFGPAVSVVKLMERFI